MNLALTMCDKMMEESCIKKAAVQNQSSLMDKWYEHSLWKKKRFCLKDYCGYC